MKALTQADLDQLNALSSESLSVDATPQKIVMRLKAVVALSNFKTLAAAGRSGHGASFNSTSKTLTLPLIPKSRATKGTLSIGFPGAPGSTVIDVVRVDGACIRLSDEALGQTVAFSHCDVDRLIALAKRLAGGKAKTFRTTKEAFASRNRTAVNTRASRPEDMDMPMWDPARGEWYDQEVEVRAGGVERRY